MKKATILIGALITISAIGAYYYNQDVPIYSTYGVHNPPDESPCTNKDCIYPQGGDRPENPTYPEHWISNWTMYTVFKGYEKYSPPYNGAPPSALVAEQDYHISYGTTYYDSNWTKPGSSVPVGAMMEKYDKKCLPIFPNGNDYSCSFISLGDIAFFLAGETRPKWQPKVCLFSNYNHPPRRDFIKHLPYSKDDSLRMGISGGQGYSFWVEPEDGKPIQVGVQPDRTNDEAIMFGYGFAPKESRGTQMPQSFYFSGFPGFPSSVPYTPKEPFAPIVSQNYTEFKIEQPDPSKTWDLVSSLDPKKLPVCDMFTPHEEIKLATFEGHNNDTTQKVKVPPTWNDIGRYKKD